MSVRRPLFAACLTVLLLTGVLRFELSSPAKPGVAAKPLTHAPRLHAHGRAARRPHARRPGHLPAVPARAVRRQPIRTGRGTPAPVSAPAPTPTAHRTQPGPRPTATARPATPTPTRTKAPRATAPNGTYSGTASDTPYGTVQVQITVSNGRITDVKALQMPSDSQRSRDISTYAEPQLRQEALDAQSASIDDVSGATYTSEGYKQSLQSAIDRSGL